MFAQKLARLRVQDPHAVAVPFSAPVVNVPDLETHARAAPPIRERRVAYGSQRRILQAADVFGAFRERFDARDREEFLVLLVDGKGYLMGFNQVSAGTLTASLVHPREVFKAAIIANACSILLVHNHPSGDPTPSAEDRTLTGRLKSAGELIGIKVMDHVVVGDGRFISFVETGLLIAQEPTPRGLALFPTRQDAPGVPGYGPDRDRPAERR